MFSLFSRSAMRKMSVVQYKPAAPAAVSFLSQLRAFSDEVADKATGHVKWFDAKKGFGFITPVDGGDDVFVHQTVIHAEGFRSLADGEEVTFNIETDDTGRQRAADVTAPCGGFVQGAPRNDNYFHDDEYRS